MYEMRGLAFEGFLPFVVARHRDQAAPAHERHAEHRLDRNGFSARVDQVCAAFDVLRRGWNQAPAHEVERALSIAKANDGKPLCGRRIVGAAEGYAAARDVPEALELGRGLGDIASAHLGSIL